ncbi:MAG TPA: hypothetical protein VF980_09730 [Thermoanaerobaculia bacterium]
MQRAVALCGALLLCVALIFVLRERRGPYFARPLTVMDHAGVREHETREALLLIPQVEPLLPRGAEVTCFRPRKGQAWNDDGVYLTAVGLLPHQSVLPPWTAGANLRGQQVTQYVIAVGAPLDHPSYAAVAQFPQGWLYKRR